jgi:putative toxin-antitoxin system antitoxin component (TIGR02293 family)
MNGSVPLSSLYPDDPMERHAMTLHGIPARAMKCMSSELDLSQDRVFRMLGVASATAKRQVRDDDRLSTEATERTLFIAGLIKTVEQMIPDDKREGFNASHWVTGWLSTPQPMLRGRPPEEFLGTAEGRAMVSRSLSTYETGAYA